MTTRIAGMTTRIAGMTRRIAGMTMGFAVGLVLACHNALGHAAP
jgi:hypothetical protein